ncbi:MAG: hypothetical protein EPO09_07180 [Aquabacterium sp.]|uniref:hypothetical protein n=1 Tax=Aquabacterium sp. TaxID=1872578 RepID=UPI00122B8A0E|nr:hypothetical protein [Aquabacterium sp.]TAK95907.1 MAG: hypothetical protein EPO09_07180 [Aquabacterium sp.]
MRNVLNTLIGGEFIVQQRTDQDTSEALQGGGFSISVPVMTREAFATAIGLPVGVLIAQADRGMWPTVRVGKRTLINVEAVRVLAAQKAQEFDL